MAQVWSIAIYFMIVVLIVTVMLILSYLLGERHRERATGEVYESGMVPTGSARMRLSVKYYLVAVFFVIFDLEAIFIYTWAVSFRELGWAGYIEALIFIGVLFAALIYLWRSGGLDWGPNHRLQRGSNTLDHTGHRISSSEKEQTVS